MRREPLITIASMTALVAALIALATSFGLDLTGDQQAAIMGVLAVAAPFAVAFAGRSQVYSVSTVDHMSEEAIVLDDLQNPEGTLDLDELGNDLDSDLVGEFDDDFKDDEDESESDLGFDGEAIGMGSRA